MLLVLLLVLVLLLSLLFVDFCAAVVPCVDFASAAAVLFYIQVTGLRKAVYVGRDITSSTGKTVRQLVRDQVATSLPGQIE